MNNATYALILAGGSGTRFWPLSRNAKPKQLLDLFSTGTLIEQTVKRLEGLVPIENILILTNALQVKGIQEAVPHLPKENIFAEPAKRDTAPAVALGIGLVAARDPKAVMMVLPADQLIADQLAYHAVMRDALCAAEKTQKLVTIGIKPTWPCPSYGYIERGELCEWIGDPLQHPPVEVKRFREKPSTEVAAEFLRAGGFSWNAGMFVWSVEAVTKELHRHTPELANFIHRLEKASDVKQMVEEEFVKLSPISIDYALMEKSDRVLNIEASFDWDDIGSWISVSKYYDTYGEENRANEEISQIDSKNNIVFNARAGSRVALLGVEDLIVVQTEDGLLIANRHQADAIKKLTDILPEHLL